MKDAAANRVGLQGSGGWDPVAAPSPSSEGERSARAYRTPRLECYGRLADRTGFGGSTVVDSGGNLGNLPGT